MPILNMVGGSQKGGNIGEPLNLTVITTPSLDATITWEDNEIGTIPPTSFQKSELVRKVGSAPTSPSDGTLVVTETVKDTYKTTGYTDSGLTDGTTYYYRVFSYSDLGGISYCDAKSITASSGGWQPGADTIVYYPFNTDWNDYSGNGYNFTTTNSTQITTVGGVHCLDMNGSTCSVSSIDTLTTYADYTWLTWIYVSSGSIDGAFADNGQGWGGSGFRVGQNKQVRWGNPVNTYSTFSSFSSNQWVLFGIVMDNGEGSIYQNLVKTTLIGSGGLAPYNNTTPFSFSGKDGVGAYGYISNFIIEKRAWTAQEIQDYYDQTKSIYGIS